MNILSKKIAYTLLIILAIGLYSCSSDDDSSTVTPIETNHVFFPLSIGNDWTYDVSTNDGTNPPSDTVDILTVDETTIIDSEEYFGMSSSDGSSGVMSQLLDQNYFRVENSILYTEGDFTLPLSNFGGTDIVINLNNVKLLDESLSNGTVMYTQSGSEAQNIGGFDLDIEYTFKTIQREFVTSHTVGDDTYNDVLKSDMVLSIKVTTEVNVGVPVIITLVDTQDVLTINNFYADTIGLVDSNTVFTYQLEDLSALPVTIPIPETATINTDQEITAYTIN